MLVLGIVGSPRKGGNTEILMKQALNVCQEEGYSGVYSFGQWAGVHSQGDPAKEEFE